MKVNAFIFTSTPGFRVSWNQMNMSKTTVSKQRMEDVMTGVDAFAKQAALSSLTSRQLSQACGVAEGVIFRLFHGLDQILEQWIETRGSHLLTLINGIPANRDGFLNMLRSLFEAPELLGLLFDQVKGGPSLLMHLDELRLQVEKSMGKQLENLAPPDKKDSNQLYLDHLLVSLRRSWDPRTSAREERQQRLLDYLPWEVNKMETSEILPDTELLKRLAINESGFIFDPVNGRSFTVNQPGLAMLNLMVQENSIPDIIEKLVSEWQVEPGQAERDLLEFSAEMRKAFRA